MFEKMRAIIAQQLNIPEEEIQEDSNFKEDLDVDSLDLFEMVMTLEDEFHVEIGSDDLESLVTVKDVMDYMKAKGVEE